MKKTLFLLLTILISCVSLSAQYRSNHGHFYGPRHPRVERHHPRMDRHHSMGHRANPKAPEFLKKGDKIAILSPSSVPTDLSIIDKGAAAIRNWGFEVVEGKHARSNYHTYAGTPEERVADIMWALRDPSIKAIVCSRGGYGSANCLNLLPVDTLRKYPKWIIGYSDITGFLSAEVRAGNMGIHGNMCGYLAKTGGTDQLSLYLRDMLMGKMPRYEVPGNKYNKPGKASGILIGGNMCVYGDIADTPFDFLDRAFIDGRDIILFIEEVEEPYSRIDRMFQHLILRGAMDKIKALVVGRFDGCPTSRGYNSVFEFIDEYVRPYNIPVCYDFPAGHDETWNYPLIEGCPVTLDVAKDKVTMEFNIK